VTATCARDRSDEGCAEPNGGTSEDGAAQQLTDVRTAARDGATRRLQTAVEARRGGRSALGGAVGTYYVGERNGSFKLHAHPCDEALPSSASRGEDAPACCATARNGQREKKGVGGGVERRAARDGSFVVGDWRGSSWKKGTDRPSPGGGRGSRLTSGPTEKSFPDFSFNLFHNAEKRNKPEK
jgi:hypothetical protein